MCHSAIASVYGQHHSRITGEIYILVACKFHRALRLQVSWSIMEICIGVAHEKDSTEGNCRGVLSPGRLLAGASPAFLCLSISHPHLNPRLLNNYLQNLHHLSSLASFA